MGAVATIALTTPVVFGIGTFFLIRRGNFSFMESLVPFIFGLSMAGTAIGASFLAGGNAATHVVGTGAKTVEQEVSGGSGSSAGGSAAGGATGGAATGGVVGGQASVGR
jgi:multisubunit Na+/H+ antiporter MnhC subunit